MDPSLAPLTQAPNLCNVKTPTAQRQNQCDKVREWIELSKETLLLQDTYVEDNVERTVTLIANQSNNYEPRQQSNNGGRNKPESQTGITEITTAMRTKEATPTMTTNKSTW